MHSRMIRIAIAALALVAALGAASPRPGLAQGTFGSQLVHAELVPGWRTDRGTHMAALRLRLADGWKTYWRIPGEAGIPPQMDWSRSQNLNAVQVHWPRPIVFDQDGFRSIGYAQEVTLPLELTPNRSGRPIALMGDITIGVCRETCVPVDLSLSLAVRGAGAHDPMIAEALARGPRPAPLAGLTRATCTLRPTERGAELTLRLNLPRSGAAEHVVVELPGTGYWLSDSRTRREGDELIARVRVRDPQRGPVALNRAALSATILSDRDMLTMQGCTAD